MNWRQSGTAVAAGAALLWVSACGGDGGPTPSPASPTPATTPLAGADAGYRASAGFGTATVGGLAGNVIHVTSLAASGAGSLRAALEAAGPRLVVFDVGGVIDLQRTALVVREPFVTIAGQTAPAPGITLIRGGLQIATHDVVVQHLAVRPGDAGAARASGWEPDAISAVGSSGRPAHDIVFDHCSATWGVDEGLSVSGPADVLVGSDPDVTSHGVTLYRCLIAEGLSYSTHSKGEHSKGTLIHDSVYDVSVIGCLYAHNMERNPRLKGGARAAVVNSVMYDWGQACIGVGTQGNDALLVPAVGSFVGNVAIAGPSTTQTVFVRNNDTGAQAYMADNLLVSRSGLTLSETNAGVTRLASASVWPPGLTALPAAQVYADVLRRAGARPAQRDAIDARIVASVISRSGRIVDSQNDVGGYPAHASTQRVLTVPEGVDARREWLERLAADLAVAPIEVPALQ